MSAWWGEYIGLPFLDRGRTRDGLDCWGLVRLVYWEQRGLILPDLGGEYLNTRDGDALAPLLQSHLPAWRSVAPGEFAVALFTLPDGRLHVGVMVDAQRVLHATRDCEACIERLASLSLFGQFNGCFVPV